MTGCHVVPPSAVMKTGMPPDAGSPTTTPWSASTNDNPMGTKPFATGRAAAGVPDVATLCTVASGVPLPTTGRARYPVDPFTIENGRGEPPEVVALSVPHVAPPSEVATSS